MDPKLLDTIIALAAALATLAIAGFTYWAARQARRAVEEATRTAARGEVSSRKLATIHYLTTWMNTYLRLPEEIDSHEELRGEASLGAAERDKHEEAMRHSLIELFYIWETLAAGINAGVYDPDILDQMTGTRLLSHYQKYADFVRRARREKGLRYYDQLDILIDRLMGIRCSTHHITEDTCQKLKAAYVDADIIKRLRGLRPEFYNSGKQLSASLVKHGLEREKNLISAYSRCPSLSIADYHTKYQEDVVNLFESVQRAVHAKHDYQWPPVPSGERQKLTEWIFVQGPHLRNYVVLYNDPK